MKSINFTKTTVQLSASLVSVLAIFSQSVIAVTNSQAPSLKLTKIEATVIARTKATSPDPIFKDIIPKIRRELPHDMVMRLPVSVPKVYKEALNNSQGTQVYANDSDYSAEVNGGSYIVRLSRTPECRVTACGVGYISASRNKPSIHDSDSGIESKDKEESIQIKPGLSGYYFYARAGSAGHRHNIYWQQNGVYFHLNFRGFEKEEVRQMAASMAAGNLIRSSIATGTKTIDSYTKCKVTVENISKYCFQRGDRGTYITNISALLKDIGYYQGKPSNEFNREVEKSVTRFQRDYRLIPFEGIVENKTLLKMCQVKHKGCSPNDNNSCYTGSPRGVVSCLNEFKSNAEKDKAYSN
jgi:hypothetical protein